MNAMQEAIHIDNQPYTLVVEKKGAGKYFWKVLDQEGLLAHCMTVKAKNTKDAAGQAKAYLCIG